MYDFFFAKLISSCIHITVMLWTDVVFTLCIWIIIKVIPATSYGADSSHDLFFRAMGWLLQNDCSPVYDTSIRTCICIAFCAVYNMHYTVHACICQRWKSWYSFHSDWFSVHIILIYIFELKITKRIFSINIRQSLLIQNIIQFFFSFTFYCDLLTRKRSKTK